MECVTAFTRAFTELNLMQSMTFHPISLRYIFNIILIFMPMGQDSVVGIVTRYGPDGLGLNPSGGEIISISSDWP